MKEIYPLAKVSTMMQANFKISKNPLKIFILMQKYVEFHPLLTMKSHNYHETAYPLE